MTETFLLLLAYFVASSVFGGILAVILTSGPQQGDQRSALPEMNFRYRTLERKFYNLEESKIAAEETYAVKIKELKQKLVARTQELEKVSAALNENESLREKVDILEQVKASLSEKLEKQTADYRTAISETERLRRKSQLEVISLKAEIGQLKVQLSSMSSNRLSNTEHPTHQD